jgi:hypothetical protein
MIKRISLIAFSLLIMGFLVFWTNPVKADSKLPQAFVQTPTADANGRIIYKVKKVDTCIGLQLRFGVEVATIIQLNKLDDKCTLTEGMDLILGVYERPTVSITPTATPGPKLPTPTAYNGNAKVCISLFFDTNGNAMPENNEPPIENGAFSIQDKDNKINENGRTGLDPACKDIPEGDYNISVAPPEGFNPTTNMNYSLKVLAGETHIIPFGAQPNSAAVGKPTPGDISTPTQNSDGIWLLLVGMLLILSGIGLGVYFVFISRKNRIL